MNYPGRYPAFLRLAFSLVVGEEYFQQYVVAEKAYLLTLRPPPDQGEI